MRQKLVGKDQLEYQEKGLLRMHQDKKRGIKKKVVLSIVGFLLLFSILSMAISIFIYNGQFPRYERHDTTVTAGLRYEDFEEQYPRSLVSFQSGPNRLQGYVYGSNQEQGLVVVAHGIGGGADSYLSQITFLLIKDGVFLLMMQPEVLTVKGSQQRAFPKLWLIWMQH